MHTLIKWIGVVGVCVIKDQNHNWGTHVPFSSSIVLQFCTPSKLKQLSSIHLLILLILIFPSPPFLRLHFFFTSGDSVLSLFGYEQLKH